MDSDDNPEVGADIGQSDDDARGETAEQAAERRSAEEDDLRNSIAGLSRLA